MAQTKSPGDRGKSTETKVTNHLKRLNELHLRFAFERLPDARAAGGRLKAQLCDFLCWWWPDYPSGNRINVQLEVKETEHEYRLAKDKLAQLPRLRKVAKAGGHGVVLIFHSTLGKWRVAPVSRFDGEIPPSWDLRDLPLIDTLGDALARTQVFPFAESK